MSKNRGIIVETSKAIIKKLIEMFSLEVFAEEPNDEGEDGGDDTPKTPTLNYEDLIAKARKEEKEKQYKKIEQLKAQIDTLTKQHNDDLLVVASLKENVKEAEAKLSTSNKGDSEEVNTLKEELKLAKDNVLTLTTDLEKFKSQVISREDVEAEVRAELEEEYKVKTYKAEKMAELRDEILVPELVMGTTIEEIDASIKSAIDRSAEIKKSLGFDGKLQKRTPKSPSNPSVSKVQDKEISLEYLNSLDVSSKEYAEVRKQLGLK